MDHVIGRSDDTNLFVDRNDERMIDFEQVVIAFRCDTMNLITRGR